jgi:hypothetical protein
VVRILAIILGGAIGAIAGTGLIATYISLTYPNYQRDSGVPELIPGILFGGPVGFVAGIIVAAVFLARRKSG